jgi:hypothetical protein
MTFPWENSFVVAKLSTGGGLTWGAEAAETSRLNQPTAGCAT